MQKSFYLLSSGISAGLAVFLGAILHSHTHPTPTLPVVAKTTSAYAPITAATYGRLPLSFEANQGQVDKQVAFLSHGPGYNLFLTDNQVVLSLRISGFGVRGSGIENECRGHFTKHKLPPTAHGPRIRTSNQQPVTSNPDAVLRLKLLGANAHPQITGKGELSGITNYFIGNDPKRWRTHVPTYSKVEYKQIYPGIDMVYYGNQKQLEYDWVVAPGADVNRIQLAVKGAERVTLTPQGDLQLHTENGDVIQHAPVAYQDIDGIRKTVASRLALTASSSGTSEKRIGFAVASYDHTRPLVIDPVLVYSTYLGGSGGDGGNGIAVDSVGNAYLTGMTNSDDFPTEVPLQSTDHTASNNTTLFVSALNASGTALLYSTYLGGTGNDKANAIAVDSAANVYITGSTSSTDFPTKNAFQPNQGSTIGSPNAFVTKINSTGSALLYSTYLGGTKMSPAGDTGWGIAVDSSGNAYVTGQAFSTDFPLQNPYQSTNQAANYFNSGTGFVTKLNSAGSALIYSTYLGGNHSDTVRAIAVDNSGNAYITGWTSSSNFPTQNPFQSTNNGFSGGFNAFVTKFNSTGSALIYSTYLGGGVGTNGGDLGRGIAVDSAGNVYVTGQATSTDFPTQKPYQSTNHSTTVSSNAFLTKFNPTGSALVYSTYLGGNGEDSANGIAIDSQGNACVTGSTSSANFPMANPIMQTFNGYAEGYTSFVTKFNSTGSALVFSTYLGGGTNGAGAIALDSYGNAYVTGSTDVYDFPVQNPLQATNHSGGNAFVARIGNYNWQTVDLTVGSDNKSRLLWVNTNFTVGLWTVNNSGQSSNLSNLGPFTGYTVQSAAAGADGLTRMLWNKTDGTASLWLLSASNAFVNGFNFGPYTGWSAVDVAVGSDNKTRLLWTKSDGTAGVWTVDNNGVSSNLTNIGPYAGWTASRIATGKDGLTRLLWTKNDGTVGVWLLNANNTYRAGFNFGPYTGWRGIDIAVGSDNKTRLLWSKSDGTAGVWTVDNNGVSSNLTNVGPFTGWTATKIACGGDGLSRLLWFKGDGTQGLWLLNANNTFNNGYNFGPY